MLQSGNSCDNSTVTIVTIHTLSSSSTEDEGRAILEQFSTHAPDPNQLKKGFDVAVPLALPADSAHISVALALDACLLQLSCSRGPLSAHNTYTVSPRIPTTFLLAFNTFQVAKKSIAPVIQHAISLLYQAGFFPCAGNVVTTCPHNSRLSIVLCKRVRVVVSGSNDRGCHLWLHHNRNRLSRPSLQPRF